MTHDSRELVDELLIAADRVVVYADFHLRDDASHEIPAPMLDLWNAVNAIRIARYDRR